MMVSVLMITYKHENYIEKAIEGVLNQVVDFPIELIVADDCSPDNTEKIVNKYISSHSNGHWIKYKKHKDNIGMTANFFWAFNQCSGKYVALCEGDDFWINNYKLKKQVDFLESNASYSMCCNSSKEVDENDKILKIARHKNKLVTLSEVLKEGWFIRTASMVFRREILSKDLPPFFLDTYSSDYVLQVILLKQGNCCFFSEAMSAYRHHQGGVSKTSKTNQVKRWLKKLELLETLNNYTSLLYANEIKQQKQSIQEQLSFYLIRYPKLFKNFGFEFYLNNLNLEKALTQLFKRIKNRYSPSK